MDTKPPSPHLEPCSRRRQGSVHSSNSEQLLRQAGVERGVGVRRGAVARWEPVSKTITGEPVMIIAYRLIIEKDAESHRHMIGTFGLSMYLPRSVTSIAVPNGFLQSRTAYKWRCWRSSAAATRRSVRLFRTR